MAKLTQDLIVVIMAGGKGERLWPKSLPNKPKQFCKIATNQTMVKDTYDRFLNIVPKGNIYISTNQSNKKLLKKTLPSLAKKNTIIEPFPRDTSCAILLALLSIPFKANQTFLFSPADHYIRDINNLKKNVLTCLNVTQKTSQMTLIGIKPTSPSDSYGYMKIKTIEKLNYYVIKNFKEKPTVSQAKKYLKTKKYLWNSGLFFFKGDHLLNLYKKYFFSDCENIKKYLNYVQEKKMEMANKHYNQVTQLSFDYGIVEKLKNINCITADFDWDDVGNWESLYRIKKPDKDGNIFSGNIQSFKNNSIICESDITKKIVLNGLKDIIIINTEHALYITSRNEAGNIKKILKKLK